MMMMMMIRTLAVWGMAHGEAGQVPVWVRTSGSPPLPSGGMAGFEPE